MVKRNGRSHLGILLFSLALLTARSAWADYVCSVAYDRGAAQYGREGRLWVSLYAGPSCTGGWRGTGYLCSADPEGPGRDYCAAPPYQLSESGLLTQLRLLQAAAASNQRVSRYNVTCASGVAGCLGYFAFHSN